MFWLRRFQVFDHARNVLAAIWTSTLAGIGADALPSTNTLLFKLSILGRVGPWFPRELTR